MREQTIVIQLVEKKNKQTFFVIKRFHAIVIILNISRVNFIKFEKHNRKINFRIIIFKDNSISSICTHRQKISYSRDRLILLELTNTIIAPRYLQRDQKYEKDNWKTIELEKTY